MSKAGLMRHIAFVLMGLGLAGIAVDGSGATPVPPSPLFPGWGVFTGDRSCFLNGSTQDFALVFNWRKDHPSGLTLLVGSPLLAKGGSFAIDTSDPGRRWEFQVEQTGRLIYGPEVERLKAALVLDDSLRLTISSAGEESKTFDPGLRDARVGVAMFDACRTAVAGDLPSATSTAGGKERRPTVDFDTTPACFMGKFYDIGDGLLYFTLEAHVDRFLGRFAFAEGMPLLIDASDMGGPAEFRVDGPAEFSLTTDQSRELRRDLVAGRVRTITVTREDKKEVRLPLGGAAFTVPAAIFDACVVAGTGGAAIPPSPPAEPPGAAR